MSIIINGIFIFIICAAIFLLIQKWLAPTAWLINNFDYQCSRCGGYIYLTTWQALLALHMMGRKWVRCLHCEQMTWAVPIR